MTYKLTAFGRLTSKVATELKELKAEVINDHEELMVKVETIRKFEPSYVANWEKAVGAKPTAGQRHYKIKNVNDAIFSVVPTVSVDEVAADPLGSDQYVVWTGGITASDIMAKLKQQGMTYANVTVYAALGRIWKDGESDQEGRNYLYRTREPGHPRYVQG